MSRLKGADLGILIPSSTPSSVTKNSAYAGVPVFFAGRSPGDQHTDTSTGKVYVLSGSGTSVYDDFENVTRSTVAGKKTTDGTATWQLRLTNDSSIAGGQVIGTGSPGQDYITLPSGGQSLYAEVVFPTGGSLELFTNMNTSGGSRHALTVNVDNGTMLLGMSNGSSTEVPFANQNATLPGLLNRVYKVYLNADATGVVTYRIEDSVTGAFYTNTINSFGSTANNVNAGFALDVGPRLNYIALTGVGTLAWTATNGPDATAMHYKSAYNSATVYAVNDTVTDAYALYVALAAVPSGKGAPSTNPTFVPASLRSSVSNTGANGGGGFYTIIQPFTTGAAPQSVVAIEYSTVNSQGGSSGGTARVGIASSLGADPTAITWVGGVTPTPTAISATTTATSTLTLPSTLTLAASTTYYVVFQGVTGDGAYGIATNALSGATVTNGIASVTALRYSSSSNAAYGTFASGIVPLALISGYTPYWQKIGVTNESLILTGIVPGGISVANHIIKPGFRIPFAATVTKLVVRTDVALSGGATTIRATRYNNGTATSDTIIATIPDGSNSIGVNVSILTAQGDIWKFDVTAAAGSPSDLLISLEGVSS